ncbi:MAG: ArsA family ATPase [Microthrixaceae bacterium]
MSRVLLFTGKGGVGKTTTAAATALDSARRGNRTVVTSADPAHSLADVFDVALRSDPVEVAAGCMAQQLDVLERMQDSWGEVRSWLVELFEWAGLSGLVAEELAVLPGLDELVSLMEIESLAGSGEYDVVVVDCAPTAETIKLLSLPEVLDWYMRKAFPASRRLSGLMRPVLGRMSDIPLASPEVFDAVEDFHHKLVKVRNLLTDGSRTTARIVVTPERVVLAEARRSHAYLAMFGYHCDAVVVNRVLGAQHTDPFLSRLHASQAEQLAGIGESFAPLAVLRSPLEPSEIIGVEALGAHGAQLWRQLDPLGHHAPDSSLEVDFSGAEPVLVLPLPHTSSDAIDLVQSRGDELSVSVGPYRRNLSLPAALSGREVQRAALRDDSLRIEFGPCTPSAGRT